MRNKEPYVYIQLLDKDNELPNNEGLGNELPNNNEGLLDEGNELPNNEGDQKPKHRAQYRKGKKKLHKENLELLPVKENLRLHEGPPEGPPEELLEEIPDEEILGFEEFEEGSSDNESDEKNRKKNEKRYYLDDKAINLGKDLHKILQFIHKLPTCPPTRDKKIFSRNELYRQAIINHLMNDSEFSFLKDFQQIDDSANNLNLTDIASSSHTRVPFIIANDKNDIKY